MCHPKVKCRLAEAQLVDGREDLEGRGEGEVCQGCEKAGPGECTERLGVKLNVEVPFWICFYT